MIVLSGFADRRPSSIHSSICSVGKHTVFPTSVIFFSENDIHGKETGAPIRGLFSKPKEKLAPLFWIPPFCLNDSMAL